MKEFTKNLPYYSGLSGLQLPLAKYQFPDEHKNSTRLQYYASFFNSIEVNSTFYKLPQGKTLGRWSGSVSDPFRFTLKFWQNVTHNDNLEFADEDVTKFMTVADQIGMKKGCLLIQLPPRTGFTCAGQLARLLILVKKANNNHWTIAVEFRNASWYNSEMYDLAEEFNTTIVIHDKAAHASPFTNQQMEVLYVRLHGPAGDYRGSYSQEFLEEYATYIKHWLSEGKTVFVYFNNTMGDAFNNLRSLDKFVEERCKDWLSQKKSLNLHP